MNYSKIVHELLKQEIEMQRKQRDLKHISIVRYEQDTKSKFLAGGCSVHQRCRLIKINSTKK